MQSSNRDDAILKVIRPTNTPVPTKTATPRPAPTKTATPRPAGCTGRAIPTSASPTADLDCPDIGRKNFRVRQPDPHGFDRDRDGIGCKKLRSAPNLRKVPGAWVISPASAEIISGSRRTRCYRGTHVCSGPHRRPLRSACSVDGPGRGPDGAGGDSAIGRAGHDRQRDRCDTVKVRLADGSVEPLRLIGIDTPETVDPNRPDGCFGEEASNRLKKLLPKGRQVWLEPDRRVIAIGSIGCCAMSGSRRTTARPILSTR